MTTEDSRKPLVVFINPNLKCTHFKWSLPGAVFAYKLSISMFFVVSHFPDVPITVSINKRVFSAFFRGFTWLHEGKTISFHITTVTTLAARFAILYAASAAAKSFAEFAQFEAVTQTAFCTGGPHIERLSCRGKAWCNIISFNTYTQVMGSF